MVDDDLERHALDIAKQHWIEGISLRELGKKYKYSASTLHRKLRKWARDNRFELTDTHDRQPMARVVKPVPEVEEKLVGQTKVCWARVAQISGIEEARNETYKGEASEQQTKMAYMAGDELHRALGEVAADYMLARLRRSSVVALGSGRGVGFAVMRLHALRDSMGTRFQGFQSVHLVSLSGGARVGTWIPSAHGDLDADENVFRLAWILNADTKNLRYMGGWKSRLQPIELPAPPTHVDLALVGFGQLNTGHDFCHYEQGQWGGILVPLKELLEMQKGTDLFYKVAEVAHRLFPVGQKADLPPDFLTAIKEIDAAVYAMPSDTVKGAEEIILVGGGKQKLYALFEFLTGNCDEAPIEPEKVTFITDEWTADRILRMKECREKGRTTEEILRMMEKDEYM